MKRDRLAAMSRAFVPAGLVALMTLLVSTLGAGAATARHMMAGPVRGGTLLIGYPTDMTTFDPAQAYSSDWQVMNGTLYDGLYQFDRNGRPQLDLAAQAPTISADRRVWTFHLRKGVRFSNGMELTADDVKFSITRTLDPHLKPAPSWGQTTDAVFQGAQDFIQGKASSVSGIQVLDRYTIRLTLAQPVAIFPDLLASTYNMIVPRAVVTKESPEYFGSHPVGSGPFVLQSWQKGTRLVFVRNPYYWKKGKPYLDRIIVYVNVPASVITLKIEKGELHGLGDASQASAADVQQMRGDPRYARYLAEGQLTFVYWLDLNVHVAPFTDRRIRQAVAMAINRDHLAKLLNGLAVPATQIYIPLMPQHDPLLDRRPAYAYDPQKAAALVKSSGYHGQAITLLYANNIPLQASMAPGIQQNLQQIGLKVALRGVSHDTQVQVRSKLKGSQMSLSFWGIDFPDGYDVYSGDMACGDNGDGGTSGSHYCDPTADNLVNRAEALPLGAARDALLRRAQARILNAAAMVPLVYPRIIDLVSPKVGGFYYSPIFGWQYENYWLNR
jgi:ABC-type transport system substrate-binding protein